MERKRRWWPWIVAVVILLPGGYLLSLIPIHWAMGHPAILESQVALSAIGVYHRPIVWALDGPDWLKELAREYLNWLQQFHFSRLHLNQEFLDVLR